MIRRADMGDLDRLCELGNIFVKKFPIPVKDVDREKVKAFLDACEKQPEFVTTFVAEDRKVWGFLGACIIPQIFFPGRMATDVAFFVHPRKRGTLMAKRLVHAYEAWAKEGEADYVQIEVDGGYPRAGKFCERLGYKNIGNKYLKWCI